MQDQSPPLLKIDFDVFDVKIVLPSLDLRKSPPQLFPDPRFVLEENANSQSDPASAFQFEIKVETLRPDAFKTDHGFGASTHTSQSRSPTSLIQRLNWENICFKL